MDVELPNGVVISGVPEGANKYTVLAKALEKGLIKPSDLGQEDYSQTGGFGSNLAAGAGKGLVDLGRGIQQVSGLGDQEALQAEINESRQLDAPLMRTGGGLTGNIGSTIAATLPTLAIPGVNTLTGATLLGAGLGGLQPVAEGESRAENVAWGAGGGLLGQSAGNAIGRAVRPVRSVVDQADQGLLSIAAQEGIPTSAANKTGSKWLNTLDSVLDNFPIVGDKNIAAKAGQREAWTKAVLKRTGLDDAVSASPEALSSAKSALSQSYDDILTRNSRVSLEHPEVVDALIEAEKRINEFTPGAAKSALKKALSLFDKGEISGEEFKSVFATVRDQADDAFKGKGGGSTSLGRVLEKIRDSMKIAWEKSADPADVAALAQTDRRFAVLKAVEKSTVDGKLSPKKFFNEMERRVPEIMKYGKGDQDVANLARIGKRFVADNIPDSGTAQRQMLQNAMSGLGGAGLLGMVTGAIPPAAALNVGLGLATPLAAQRAMWGPSQRYLTQGLLSLPENASKGLMSAARSGGAAGLIGANQ